MNVFCTVWCSEMFVPFFFSPIFFPCRPAIVLAENTVETICFQIILLPTLCLQVSAGRNRICSLHFIGHRVKLCLKIMVV